MATLPYPFRCAFLLISSALAANVLAASEPSASVAPLQFRKHFVSPERYESASVFDVNNDGSVDVVSGAFWYEGPRFEKRHTIGNVRAVDDYYDDFSTIPLDVNGDGRTDFITGGWWGGNLRWRENPGKVGETWPEHEIAKTGSIETTRAWDVDGDGHVEIVPNTPGNPLVVYRLLRGANGSGTGRFEASPIRIAAGGPQKQGHGLGCGDINGDGRADFVLNSGWLEAPATQGGEWQWHPEFQLPKSSSVPILAVDVNRDGKCDLIAGDGHGYGLWWWEQRTEGGKRTWRAHEIDPYSSQYHDLMWIDLDRDGSAELVTGKRFRAHPGTDPGDSDAYGWYVFKWNGSHFVKHVIDFGPVGNAKGLGIHFAVADLDGDSRPDVVAPGKDGLALYFNRTAR